MKLAYLVFTYKNPLLLQKEIAALTSPEAHFFVHVDKKSELEPFLGINGPNVTFLAERVAVYWAEFSGVLAILSLVRKALEAPEHYDYLVLLSGSEYPLHSAAYIHSFFEANSGLEFIDLVKVPNLKAGRRLAHINAFRYPSSRPVLHWLGKLLVRLHLIRRDYRKQLGALEPYGGHTWWALSRGACEHVLRFMGEHPGVVDFFRYAAQPEETFFHTILGNSKFNERVRRSLVYEDWSAGGARPAIINEQHLAVLEASEKLWINDVFGAGEVLFARKFSDESLHLVERIEKRIG